MDALLERLTIEDNDLRGQTQVFSIYFHPIIDTRKAHNSSSIIYLN